MTAHRVGWPDAGEPGDAVAVNGATRLERRDAAEHRQQILAAARDLFAKHGVEQVQMQQIARAAGVGQGTLYRRYANKGELCMDLLQGSAAAFCHNLETFIDDTTKSRPALERLDALLQRMVAFVEENRQYLSVVRDTCRGTDRFCRPLYQRIHDAIATLLRQAADEGDLAAMDYMLTADMLQAALSPDLYHFQREVRGCTPERILQAVRHVYIAGLQTDTGTGLRM